MRIDNKYSSFKKIEYLVYNHNNVKLDVKGNFKVKMNVSNEDAGRDRFTVFELTSDGEYKQIGHTYKEGYLEFTIASNSQVVFATRDIEYNVIFLFNAVLLISLCFVIVYRIKHSRIKEEIMY